MGGLSVLFVYLDEILMAVSTMPGSKRENPMVTHATETTNEQKERFDRDGFVVIRQLIGADEVKQIRDMFMEQGKNGPVPGMSETKRDEHGYASSDPLSFYPRMMHPHRHPELAVGPLAMRYMLDRRLYPILRECFGEEPVAVQSMFYFKPPGARGQALHQDNFYLRVKPGTCLAAWFAIDDADEDNGGMVVVPGSNRMEIVCPEKADSSRFFTTEHVAVPAGLEEVPINLKAGDVLFFNGSLIHGSYPNTSKDRFRRSLIFHYVPMGSVELSNWYQNPLGFDGKEISIPEATGGGPCGTMGAEISAPH